MSDRRLLEVASSLSDCPVCRERITDHTPVACELPDGQRYHVSHLPMPVRSLMAAGRSGAWERAVADFDRYLDAGGRFSFVVWAERYAADYVAVAGGC